jgi:hypothetical protein
MPTTNNVFGPFNKIARKGERKLEAHIFVEGLHTTSSF